MKTIGAFDAKTHLSDLLDQVERGDSFLITKRGRPMATLSPVSGLKGQGPRDIVIDFRKKFAKSLRKFSQRELSQWKAEGRR
jgi:prevent-host-death family protein